MTSIIKRQNNYKQRSNNCLGDIYCSSNINPIDINSDFYQSIDLVEQNLIQKQRPIQGSCGSCFAIIASQLSANTILNDQNYIKQNNHTMWINNSQNIQISTQFILSNALGGGNEYCSGGDTGTALNYISNVEQSLEIIENYPYNPNQYNSKTRLPIIINESNYYMPFKMFQSNISSNEYVPTINLFNDYYWTQEFNQTTKNLIKAYLSRGQAIAIQLFVPQNSYIFNSYNGGIITDYECSTLNTTYPNHQVIIVGYGKLKQNNETFEVWKIQNTWGEQWSPATDGYFFVRTDQNQFCMNYWADTVVGKGFTGQKIQLNLENRGKGGQWLEKDNEQIQEEQEYIESEQEEQIDEQPNNKNQNILKIVLIVLACLVIISIIITLIICLIKRKQNQTKQILYI